VRLGDLDALENAIDKERQNLIEQGRPGAEHIVVHHARRIVEDAPTIDAIPVEWLKKYQLENEKQGSYDMVGAIEVTLWDWEKEQEAR